MLQKATIDEIYNLLYTSESTLNNGYATTLYTLKDFNTIDNEIVYNNQYINIFSWIDFLNYIERKYTNFTYLFPLSPLVQLTDTQKVIHFHDDFTEFYNKNQNAVAMLRGMLFERKALDEMLKNVKTKDKKVPATELFKQADVK